MADNTPIEWADATVNAINGCSLASPGCTNCYAMKLAGTRMKNHPSRVGLTIDTKNGPVWTGEVRLHEPALLQPLRWKRPRTIFWNAHGDTFHEAVPDEWLDRMFAVISLSHWHRHLVLSKRSDRMRDYFSSPEVVDRVDRAQSVLFSEHCKKSAYSHKMRRPAWNWPLPNLWLGVSVEDQTRADERIPHLLLTPAAGRFLSCEPLLGPIDLSRIVSAADEECFDAESARGRLNALSGAYYVECLEDDGTWVDCCGPDVIQRGFDPGARWHGNGRIDGVIVGGESGPGARPMHPQWARQIRDDCAAAGVDFHFKQWGDWLPEKQIDRDRFQWAPGQDGRVHWWIPEPSYGSALPDGACSVRIGKRQAGRTLDGVTHDALPWRRAA